MLKWVSRLASAAIRYMPSTRAIALIGAGMIFTLGAGVGWKASRTLAAADQAKVYQDWAESVRTLDEAHRTRERELLSETRRYRATVRKMSNEVRTTADGCQLSADSLRDIQTTVAGLFPAE